MLEDDTPIDISAELSEEERKAVSIIRLSIDNPLLGKISDTTIAACYRELDDKYGQFSGEYQAPLDYDIEIFTQILDKVRMEIENKHVNGEPEIKNINAYTRQATMNYWREGQ